MSEELNVLEGITLSEEGFISSVDLVDIINYFRAIEREEIEGKGEKPTRLQNPIRHDSLLRKIRDELEILKSLGLGDNHEFVENYYKDSNNRSKVCYLLNRDGMLMILNSESTLVRYKTVEYINKLEKENKELKEDNEQLYEVAVSDKELAEREYEANKVKYSLRNVKNLLLDCDYTNLEATVNKIVEVQVGLKKKDRYEYYRDMDKTEYKQYVRAYIKDKLNDVMITKPDIMLTMVAKTIQLQLESESHTTTKRSTSHVISAKDKELEELPTIRRELLSQQLENDINNMIINNYKDKYDTNANDINNYQVVDVHGMSCNYLFKYDSQYGTIKTSTYKKWIKDFERSFWDNGLATKEDWEDYEDVDFSKPIVIYIKYVAKEEFDIENFNKSTIDMIFNRLFGVDDNIVHKVVSERLATCDTYADGKILYYIENL